MDLKDVKYDNLEAERFIQISLFLSSGHSMLALAGWWTKSQVINRQSFKILLKSLQRKRNFEEIEVVRHGGIISSPLRLHSSSYQIFRLVSIFLSDLMSHKYALFDIEMDIATQI